MKYKIMCADASLNSWPLPSIHVHPIIFFFIHWYLLHALFTHARTHAHTHTSLLSQVTDHNTGGAVVSISYLGLRTLKRLDIPHKHFLVPGSNYYALTALFTGTLLCPHVP